MSDQTFFGVIVSMSDLYKCIFSCFVFFFCLGCESVLLSACSHDILYGKFLHAFLKYPQYYNVHTKQAKYYRKNNIIGVNSGFGKYS